MAFTFVFLIFLYGLFGMPGYVLTGISLYSIASRRGIERPWLAWVPGLSFYILGCISDQYQAIVRGKNKNKRTALFFLIFVPMIAFCVMHIAAPSAETTSNFLPFLLVFVPAWCACAALVVISFMALYDLYVSCDPKNAVLFLVLSIIFNVTQPFFLFACRNKDLGFPL